MSSQVQSHAVDAEDIAQEAKQIVAAAHAEADEIIAAARRSATEVYEVERGRSVQRLAEVRDEYERLSSRLRALKEATDETITMALRDHEAIRRVLDD